MRSNVLVLAAVLAVLAVGWVGYFLWFERGQKTTLVVLQANGDVQRHNPAAGGAPVFVGDRLLARDRVQVGEGSGAVLGVGDDTRLRLDPLSVIEVVSVDAEGVMIELEDGRVQARVRAGSPRLAVSSRGRTVQSNDADFTVGADDDVLAVQVERGAVELAGPAGTEQVGMGESAVANGARSPILQTADTRLLLEVKWPDAQTKVSEIKLAGTTAPYARLGVTGAARPVRGRADADGGFHLAVQLREGRNDLVVRAWDALGREITVTGRAALDSTAPAAQSVDVSWGG